MGPGSVITTEIEKPVAGGRMLARHEGQVVLVWGGIPGEQIRVRIERMGRGVVYAEAMEIVAPSSDRRTPAADQRCGGSVYAHIRYDRQVTLKGEVIRDSIGRIGRVPLPAPPPVIPSPERGYRMRARFHARDGRLGFFREGTHDLCDPASTGQLLPETLKWIARTERFLRTEALTGVVGVELAENMAGDERACHVELEPGVDRAPFAPLAATPWVTDILQVREGGGAPTLRLRRSARAFFQANRYLLEPLVQHVTSLVPDGPVVDLYAGVGLFGLSVAAAGADRVTLVEGDRASAADLEMNAEPYAVNVRVERCSVEDYLARELGRAPASATFIVDPPRTGMSKAAMAGIVDARPAVIVYVSCDVATLARDTRTLLDAGYQLEGLTGFDLFPNTAHVETVAHFVIDDR
jgi:23S rRNA (uracil1939-C5)-methyltransferase